MKQTAIWKRRTTYIVKIDGRYMCGAELRKVERLRSKGWSGIFQGYIEDAKRLREAAAVRVGLG